MQHYSNTARRRLLFCVPVEEEISENRVLGQSWDVMDQFPPCNSHDKDGSLLFKRICVEGMSPRKDVQGEADPSSAPRYVCFYSPYLIVNDFLDRMPKQVLQSQFPIAKCSRDRFYNVIRG